MTAPALLVERDGAVAVLRLNEPERRNALSPAIKAALEIEVPVLLGDSGVRCLVITGTAGAFCAGGDIASLVEPMTFEVARARLARSYRWIEPLLDGPIPVVTAVNGAAVGAGFGLAMLGDIVIAARNAWFMGGFGTIGVAADYALGRTLPRAVGAVRAKDILFSGRRVDAEEAERIGLVSRLVDDDRLNEEALRLARKLAEAPTAALALTKQLVSSGFEGSAADYLDREGRAQATAFGSADHREGVAAFLAKRTPRFIGR